jgi:uncharacterized Zn finger protein
MRKGNPVLISSFKCDECGCQEKVIKNESWINCKNCGMGHIHNHKHYLSYSTTKENKR